MNSTTLLISCQYLLSSADVTQCDMAYGWMLQVDQRVLKDFMAEKMPRLTAHFEEHSVDVSLITFSWFLVVFVESLPSDILLRVWDAFLYEGTKVPRLRETSAWAERKTETPSSWVFKCGSCLQYDWLLTD